MDEMIIEPVKTELKMEKYPVAYVGKGSSLFGLCFQNLLLKIVTLGIYSPWAKTAFRQHVWQNLKFNDHSFAYHGTGIELFRGLMKVLGLYLIFFVSNWLVDRAFGPGVAAVWTAIMVGTIFLFLIPRIILAASRYQLSRTSWRGIRFGLRRIESEYNVEWLKCIGLTAITFGIYAPIMAHRLYKVRMNAIHFGNQNFRYSGEPVEEFSIYLKGFFLSILTLGIYSFWFRAEIMRYRAAHTHFGQATFSQNVFGTDVLAITLVSGFLTIITLGLGFAWAFTYSMSTICNRISAEGFIDFESVLQTPVTGNASGDMLSDVLGLEDIGIGIEL